MDWKYLFFGFGGRINRAKYWLGALMLVVAWFVVAAVVTVIVMSNSTAGYALGALLGGLAVIAGLWAGLGLGVKRLHDRNKSGWWLLLFWLVPSILQGGAQQYSPDPITQLPFILAGLAIAIWGFVEIGCLRGTAGPNDYGPDPLPAA